MLNEEEEKFFEKHFPSKRKNFYKILGVSKDSTMEEITNAYRKLALQYHPKNNPNNEEAHKKFVEVNEAYQTLSNKGIRSSYDDLVFGEILPRRAFDIFENFFEDKWMDMPSETEFFTPIFSRRRPWQDIGQLGLGMGRTGLDLTPITIPIENIKEG
jgi:DnaJ-class molecular chaperone